MNMTVSPDSLNTSNPYVLDIPEPFGPKYPNLNWVGKWRQKAKSLNALTQDEVYEYGNAVIKGILSLQRGESAAPLTPVHRPHCASKSSATSGEEILSDIRAQQITELRSGHARLADLSEKNLLSKYKLAMKLTRAAKTRLANRQAKNL